MDIKEVLEHTNIWWEKKEHIYHLVENLQRPELEKMIKELQAHRITALVGPRRTGKTTLIFQTIKHLLEHGTDPRDILFLSLDNSLFSLLSQQVLEDVFSVYFEEILFQKPIDLKKKVYIFLDEIQKIDTWAEWLKNKYDFFKNIKFVVSGSSSIKILKNTRETLVGRTSTLFLFPLTFQQFLSLHGISIPFHFHEGMRLDELKKAYTNLKKDELSIKKYLNEYFLVGGFIEWFKVQDMYRWNTYLQEDILEKLFLGDIISEYDLRDKEGLKRILLVIAQSQGNLFSLHSLSKEAIVSKDAIENYISVLKEGFVLYILDNYSRHIGVVLRKNKKINLIDIGLVNSIKRHQTLSKSERGRFLELVVQQHMYCYAQVNGFSIYFYRDNEDREIDVVLKTPKDILPIEVKLGNKGSQGNLLFFMKKFQSKRGIMLTENLLNEQDHILQIPYWLFLSLI